MMVFICHFFQVDDYKDEYLKLMSMYAILLAQSVEDPIVSDIEYAYDAAAEKNVEGSGHHAEYDIGGSNGGGERKVLIAFICPWVAVNDLWNCHLSALQGGSSGRAPGLG